MVKVVDSITVHEVRNNASCRYAWCGEGLPAGPNTPLASMLVERITVLLEQLEDTINEQTRVALLELEPSAEEQAGLKDLARACRDSAQALGSSSMSAEYARLLQRMSELVDTRGLELAEETPPPERVRDGKRVRFSDVKEEFEPERVPYRDEPAGAGVGAGAAGEPDADATDSDPRAQFQLNQNLMMEQDLRLESLGQSVGRTRQMGAEINAELGTQLEILEDLEAQTDRTQSRLGGATRGVETFNRKAQEGGSCVVITVLVVTLFILLVVF